MTAGPDAGTVSVGFAPGISVDSTSHCGTPGSLGATMSSGPATPTIILSKDSFYLSWPVSG